MQLVVEDIALDAHNFNLAVIACGACDNLKFLKVRFDRRSPTRTRGSSGPCFVPASRTAPSSEGLPQEFARRQRNETHRSDRRAKSLTIIEAFKAYQL